jgi:hypothetical protein
MAVLGRICAGRAGPADKALLPTRRFAAAPLCKGWATRAARAPAEDVVAGEPRLSNDPQCVAARFPESAVTLLLRACNSHGNYDWRVTIRIDFFPKRELDHFRLARELDYPR